MDSDTFTPEEELDAHLAAMKWLEEQRISGHEILTFQTLNDGFRWHGHRIQLINRNQGIWRPKQFRGAFPSKLHLQKKDPGRTMTLSMTTDFSTTSSLIRTPRHGQTMR